MNSYWRTLMLLMNLNKVLCNFEYTVTSTRILTKTVGSKYGTNKRKPAKNDPIPYVTYLKIDILQNLKCYKPEFAKK